MKKTIVMVDGGYLRKIVNNKKYRYNADYIEKCMLDLKIPKIDLLRILYYDCSLYKGSVKLPISNKIHTFENTNCWLNNLAEKNLFAIRKGTLKFRGFILKRKYQKSVNKNLKDEDFQPSFVQKGVDMRIGLDMAQYSHNHLVDKIILISNDSDCVPALKYARRNGIFVSIVQYEKWKITPELLYHVDEIIKTTLPLQKITKKKKSTSKQT